MDTAETTSAASPPEEVHLIGIGMPRCGTTWLSRCLAEHPEICFSRDKETHFFDIEWEHRSLTLYLHEQFSHCMAPARIRAEFTTTYAHSPEALRRINATFPRARILFVMRNPYDRTFSHYLYRKRKNGVPRAFRELFTHDPHGVLLQSRYALHLKRAWEIFGKERVLVCNHDDARRDPRRYIQTLYAKLGVDDTFTPPSLLREVNRSKNLRYHIPLIEWCFTFRMRLKKRAWGRAFITFAKQTGVHSLLVALRNRNIKKGSHDEDETLAVEDRARLREYLKDDIAELEQMLGTSFPEWH